MTKLHPIYWLHRLFWRRPPVSIASIQARMELTIASLSPAARASLNEEGRVQIDKLLADVQLSHRDDSSTLRRSSPANKLPESRRSPR